MKCFTKKEKFSAKKNKRTQKRDGSQVHWMCDICQRNFSSKYALLRHVDGMHKKLHENLFECAVCSKQFYRKDHLASHVSNHKNKDKMSIVDLKLMCEQCSKIFSSTSNLRRHLKYCENEKERLICHHCQKSFTLKYSLKRHLASTHSMYEIFPGYCAENDNVCSLCHNKFRRKDALLQHISMVHNGERKKPLECAMCHQKFRDKLILRNHISRSMKFGQCSRIRKLKCIKCDGTFTDKKLINKHYEEAHNITLHYEDLQFDSLDKFETWKLNMQRESVTQFIVQNNKENKEYRTRRYCCHRSGVYKDTCEKKGRLRKLKKYGSKKLQGFCPAEIVARIKDGVYFVNFQKTHVGHAVGEEEELRYIHLDKNEKLYIAAQLEDGIPMTEIIKRECLSSTPEEKGNRLRILNDKDVHNICCMFGVKNRYPLAGKNEEISIDSLVSQFNDHILFYKQQDQEDSRFKALDEQDFVVVIMDNVQEEHLKRYGHKIVSISNIHGIDPYNFILHTLLVVDSNWKDIPVAFLLSNRNDELVVSIFLTCIQERVGTVKPKTLVSDTLETYFNSWSTLMEEPEFYLLCSWYVCEEWNKNLKKILDKKKREEICQRLYELTFEMNTVVFEEMLTTFSSALEKDEDLQEFLEYFTKNFCHNTHQWAYCHRKFAGANTNMNTENFLRVLKCKHIGEKKIQTLPQALNYIQEYFRTKNLENKVSKTGDKRLYKMDVLKKRHTDAAGQAQFEGNELKVRCINDCIWEVKSFQSPKWYTVRKIDPKECSLYDETCQLLCEDCDICIHEYSCECFDNSIRNHFCKHIHFLGIFLQTHRVILLEETGQEMDDLTKTDDCNFNYDWNVEIIETEEIDDYNWSVEVVGTEEIEQSKSNLVEELKEALSFAKTNDDLAEIRKTFLQPIIPMLQARNKDTDTPIYHILPE